mgnify:CR=1 FL=1
MTYDELGSSSKSDRSTVTSPAPLEVAVNRSVRPVAVLRKNTSTSVERLVIVPMVSTAMQLLTVVVMRVVRQVMVLFFSCCVQSTF